MEIKKKHVGWAIVLLLWSLLGAISGIGWAGYIFLGWDSAAPGVPTTLFGVFTLVLVLWLLVNLFDDGDDVIYSTKEEGPL